MTTTSNAGGGVEACYWWWIAECVLVLAGKRVTIGRCGNWMADENERDLTHLSNDPEWFNESGEFFCRAVSHVGYRLRAIPIGQVDI